MTSGANLGRIIMADKMPSSSESVHLSRRIDFQTVNRAAMGILPALLGRWLPDGKKRGHEWVARNPKRSDRKPGSFSVNLNTGRWADFAQADARGGDVISLAAYLAGCSQYEAAAMLAKMLGLAGDAP
ncbi:hypothetical protein APT_00799 [Acetobacter pasteurianus NBRC 101655]|uniref:hypothetical protein n=1 Tax=Acetobacter pasteurianus TaxID=438 RepID=UPI00074D3DAB|nr:hypothetical protein [Acetobacter pasteurianus]BAU37881.1 hypothetical protein APT_00799 [Acetobacter pasteurianus NBRC 101655]